MDKITQKLFSSKAKALRAGFTEDNITENNGVFYGTITTSKKAVKVPKTTKSGLKLKII